jgi:hypothetical protein
MYEGHRLDFTGLASGIASPFESLIEERVVSPADLPSAKLAYHRRAIDAWARAHGMDADRAWTLRERCMELLANSTPHAVLDFPHDARRPGRRTGDADG